MPIVGNVKKNSETILLSIKPLPKIAKKEVKSIPETNAVTKAEITTTAIVSRPKAKPTTITTTPNKLKYSTNFPF